MRGKNNNNFIGVKRKRGSSRRLTIAHRAYNVSLVTTALPGGCRGQMEAKRMRDAEAETADEEADDANADVNSGDFICRT